MSNTRISLDEARKILISGKKLEWPKHLNHDAGEITLDTAQKRRLFEYLFSCNADEIEEPTDNIFKGLISAWNAETDPAQDGINTHAQPATTATWRLGD